jgi:hypothetical protein
LFSPLLRASHPTSVDGRANSCWENCRKPESAQTRRRSGRKRDPPGQDWRHHDDHDRHAHVRRRQTAGWCPICETLNRRLPLRPATARTSRPPPSTFHVVSNEPHTYLFASPTRGKNVPDEGGVPRNLRWRHGGPCRLAVYFKDDQATHAVCGSHLLRDLTTIGVGWDQGWPGGMVTLLAEMTAPPMEHGGGQSPPVPLGARLLPLPLRRHHFRRSGVIVRDSIGKECYNLVSALVKLRAEFP